MMFKHKRILLIGVMMLTALAFVACGSDDAAPAAAPTSAPPAASTAAPTPADAPTAAPDPTEAPAPTMTSEPTAPAAPTVLPQPSATSAPPAPTEAPSSGGADSVTLTPSQDNTLYEDSTGKLSSGAGTDLFIGTTNNGSDRRALIQFDIADAIPDGVTITSVSLMMSVTKTIADTYDATLHTLSSAWGEGSSSAGRGGGGGAVAEAGDATWTHAVLDGAAWSNLGGDFAATASATVGVGGGGPHTWDSTDQLVADVQAWLDDPDSNFGWIVIGDESTNKTAKRFASRESKIEDARPQLTIEYSS